MDVKNVEGNNSKSLEVPRPGAGISKRLARENYSEESRPRGPSATKLEFILGVLYTKRTVEKFLKF